MSVEATDIRVVEPGTKVTTRIRDLFRYHELIVNLVRKELRVKYKNSVLGFVWSMLNPAMTVLIFWIVFTKFIPNGIQNFPILILSGILAWNLWQGSLGTAVGSFIGNSSLVTKVYFPREVLPLASIGANLMHFFFQFFVLLAALVVFRFPVSLATLELVPAALVTELLVLCGFCLIVAVINVYFRDVQHLLELLLLAWFWMTPIVYPVAFPVQHLGKYAKIFMLNPMTPIVLAFQRGIYQHITSKDPKTHVVQQLLLHQSTTWYLRNLVVVAAGAIVLILVGWAIFRRLEWRLAEEL